MPDYIPKSDASLHIWQDSFISTLEQKAVEWGIPTKEIDHIKEKQSNWITAYTKSCKNENATTSDFLSRYFAREKLKKAIRPIIAEWITGNTNITDCDFHKLGLRHPSSEYRLVPIPTSAPIGIIDFSKKYKHSIHYCDQNIAFKTARPAGVVGCEIYIKIGGCAPKEISELTYVGVCETSPFEIQFEINQRDSFVYYWLRWINKNGECGPWSETISSMVK